MGFLDMFKRKPLTEEEMRRREYEQAKRDYIAELKAKGVADCWVPDHVREWEHKQLEKAKRDGTYRLHGKRYIYRGVLNTGYR